VQGQQAADLPLQPLRQRAVPVQGPRQARTGDDRLDRSGQRCRIRSSTELALRHGLGQQRLDRAPLSLVDGQSVLVELRIGEIHACYTHIYDLSRAHGRTGRPLRLLGREQRRAGSKSWLARNLLDKC